jgi:hypothetical protein
MSKPGTAPGMKPCSTSRSIGSIAEHRGGPRVRIPSPPAKSLRTLGPRSSPECRRCGPASGNKDGIRESRKPHHSGRHRTASCRSGRRFSQGFHLPAGRVRCIRPSAPRCLVMRFRLDRARHRQIQVVNGPRSLNGGVRPRVQPEKTCHSESTAGLPLRADLLADGRHRRSVP